MVLFCLCRISETTFDNNNNKKQGLVNKKKTIRQEGEQRENLWCLFAGSDKKQKWYKAKIRKVAWKDLKSIWKEITRQEINEKRRQGNTSHIQIR